MKEQAIQKKIQDYIKSIGGKSIKIIQSTMSGEPDLICCIKGKFYGFEIKKPGGKATELQAYKLNQIRQAGGIAECVTSVEEVMAILNRI